MNTPPPNQSPEPLALAVPLSRFSSLGVNRALPNERRLHHKDQPFRQRLPLGGSSHATADLRCHGYTDYHVQITQEDIEASLRHDLSLIEDWLAFTQDKRWTPAWGLSIRGKTEWLLFHMTKSGRIDYEAYFSSAVSACALMIRFEMEDFRCKQT